ncbi:complex I NDUFA9 subunit family protein [Altericroceibacterium xinjiangense]|uniref:complex I NDUFA9 subunit family protein n=1 Tax=Altericroceibacterium xinjiangense TaxID=762261 RepID=UPI001F49970F|nr:complex I NDUFA9 subunit family protein [Altericroceibacterium xinjiangense]
MNPLEGKLVVLVGGSGFVGTYLAQELLRRGARLRIVSREPNRAIKLKPLGLLGQIQFLRCDVSDAANLRRAMQGADAAVYLVGSFSGNLGTLHNHAAQVAAEAARDEGASAFVYLSAIGADPQSDSGYARTKAEGEEAVRAAFPRATILRPSAMFGDEDNFINLFAGLIGSYPVIPVFAPDAKLQPIWVDDVAEAVTSALSDPGQHGGKIFEIAGPETMTMWDLNQRIAEAQGRRRHFVRVSDSVAGFVSKLPGSPMNGDQWTMLQRGNVASGQLPGIQDLGITPRPLSLFLDRWMVRYRRNGRFSQRVAGLR